MATLKTAVHALPDETLSAKYKADFNAMSVKVYYQIPGGEKSSTRYYTDIIYNKDNTPTKGKTLRCQALQF